MNTVGNYYIIMIYYIVFILLIFKWHKEPPFTCCGTEHDEMTITFSPPAEQRLKFVKCVACPGRGADTGQRRDTREMKDVLNVAATSDLLGSPRLAKKC